MFKDLKEYQDITRIYNESVNISEEQRAINKIFVEEDFTLEELDYLEENWDELWENELAQFTQECISESFEEQDLTEEQIQQIDEVLGLKLLAKGALKANKAIGGIGKGLKSGLKSVGKKVTSGAKAVGTGIKDTARGALSVGKSALKKVGGAIKKAAPIIGKGALLGTGAALPLVGGLSAVNALRNRGKKEREAENKKNETKITPPPQIGGGNAGGSKDSGGTAGGDKGGGKQETKPETKTEVKPETKTEVKPETKKKKMHPIEKKNRARFGDAHVDKLKQKQADFKLYKSKKMSKDDFIKKYPKSITAQKAAGLRDHTEWDAYDMVLEYLFSTEQVTSLEEANYVMMEMDHQTIGEIVKEVKVALNEDL